MSEKKLMRLDDFFTPIETQYSPTKIEDIEIERLIPFENHPFKLYEGERFENMVRSIKEFGIIVPVIVRSKGYDYEILSGHNRVNAAKEAGILEVPVVIKDDLDDEEAMLIVTETNLMQRSFSDMLYSERAAALAEHHKALSSQGKRTDFLKEIESILKANEVKDGETSRQLGEKLTSADETGKTYNLSGRSVSRYLRICKLIKELKDRVDTEEIPFTASVTISYLTKEEQQIVEKILSENNFKIDMKKAETLRAFSEGKRLNEEAVYSVLLGEINKKPKANKPAPIKLKPKVLNKYFAPDVSKTEMEKTIEKALDLYFNK